jgi:S1-C subfamily serine protease
MALSHKNGILMACMALCLLHAPAFADDRKAVAMPPRPEAGASSTATLPALGNLSGVGKASAGLPPARVEQAVRKAQDDRADLLRTRKRDNALDVFGKSVVLVVTPDKLGSATLVDATGTFVTSWHILRDHSQVGVIFMPENRDRRLTEADAVTATVVRTDPSRNLALLEVPDRPRGMKPVRLALKHIPATGSSLSVLGHPYGEIWSLSQGTLAKVIAGHTWQSETGTQHRADVIRFRSRTATGNAGGPVLDAKGRLLAVDVQRTDDKTLASIGVTAIEVARLLATPPPSALMAPSPRNAQAKSCEPQRLGTSRTRGNDGTVHTLDLNCNGKPDALMLVPDNTKSGNHLANDANENGVTDSVYFDFNRDGRFDEVRFDTDEDGKADMLGTELDSELIPRNTRVLPK